MVKFVRSINPLVLIYIGLVVLVLVLLGVFIYPDRIFVFLLLPLFFIKRWRNFLVDWTPFVLLLLSYDYLRGFADNLNTRVHFTEMINIDQKIFGVVPTRWLQQHFYNGQLHWYDYFGASLYLFHFVVPILFAYVLWIKREEWFKRFSFSFLGLSYAGLITYLAFPAAPPWLAAQDGLLPGVTKILDHVTNLFPNRIDLPSIYYSFDPNLVAAMPSLHAAYPTIVALYTVRFFGKWGLLAFIYPVLVWVSVIYFGEHYFTDVVMGILYATSFFLLTEFVIAKTKLGRRLTAPSKNFIKAKVTTDSVSISPIN